MYWRAALQDANSAIGPVRSTSRKRPGLPESGSSWAARSFPDAWRNSPWPLTAQVACSKADKRCKIFSTRSARAPGSPLRQPWRAPRRDSGFESNFVFILSVFQFYRCKAFAVPSHNWKYSVQESHLRHHRTLRGNEAEMFFVPKSASLRRRLRFLNSPWMRPPGCENSIAALGGLTKCQEVPKSREHSDTSSPSCSFLAPAALPRVHAHRVAGCHCYHCHSRRTSAACPRECEGKSQPHCVR